MRTKIKYGFILPLAACFASIAMTSAQAHVTVSPPDVPAEGYSTLKFTVPHGCDGAATRRVVVKLPPQVVSATPEAVPGWTAKTKTGKLAKPVEQHGETVTTGVREVTWTGGPLPDNEFVEFGLSVSVSGQVGDVAEFKTVQNCVDGSEAAWIQKTVEGQDEPDYPAPTLTLTAADDGHGHAADEEDAPSTEPVSGNDASSSNSDGASNGLSIAALIVGALGLLTGGIALSRSRRTT